MTALIWIVVSLAGAAGWAVLALHRGETVNAAWLVIAAVGTYPVAYRFYCRFLAHTVFGLDDRRATPAERLENGLDYVPTNRWVLFGHHFAAIAGAGPLVGPVLAAQFGYLPGTLWIVVGVVLGRRGAGLRDPLRLACGATASRSARWRARSSAASPASWRWSPSSRS